MFEEAELEGEYEYEGEFESEYEDEGEGEFEIFEMEGVFDEAEEMELAAELLTVSDEYELEQFLGKLIKKVGSKVKRFARSATGRALGGVLKSVAKKALPIAGRAAGAFFGGPVGAAVGGKLASAAGKAFGLELEGLSPEDQEFEVARRFVRLSASAAKKAAQAPRSAPAAQVAKAAVKAAARKHAPGLVRKGPSTAAFGGRRRSGRWIRRGRRIVVLGA